MRVGNLTVFVVVLCLLIACSVDEKEQEYLLNKCRNKNSIVNFLVSYRLLEGDKDNSYKAVSSDIKSKLDSYDACDCVVAHAETLYGDQRQQLYAAIDLADKELKQTLLIFTTKGIAAKSSHKQIYQDLYQAASNIPHLSSLVSQSSPGHSSTRSCSVLNQPAKG